MFYMFQKVFPSIIRSSKLHIQRQVTNEECVYSSNTTIFIDRIKSIFYIRYNYMFRRLIMAIFRLYMKYLLRSYTKHTWAVYMG